MLDGREFHRFVPKYRKVLLKYSLFGRGTCKLFNVADLVWGNTNKVNLEKILKLQKTATRIILRADFNTLSKMLFEKLEWLTVYNRINYHKATLMFKCINKLALEYLCSMFNSINENCPYGLRSAT
jgi:uncharacterized protein (DUF608 family)